MGVVLNVLDFEGSDYDGTGRLKKSHPKVASSSSR